MLNVNIEVGSAAERRDHREASPSCVDDDDDDDHHSRPRADQPVRCFYSRGSPTNQPTPHLGTTRIKNQLRNHITSHINERTTQKMQQS